MTNKEIVDNLNAIRECMDKQVNPDNIDELIENGTKLVSLSGLAANCYGQAKARYSKALAEAITSFKDTDSRSTIIIKTAEGECFEQEALMNYSDRVTKGITNTLDFYRSVISLYKEELNQGSKIPTT